MMVYYYQIVFQSSIRKSFQFVYKYLSAYGYLLDIHIVQSIKSNYLFMSTFILPHQMKYGTIGIIPWRVQLIGLKSYLF